MNEQEKQFVKAKKAQCGIGIALLVPGALGVLSFFFDILNLEKLFEWDWLEEFAELDCLDGLWWYGDVHIAPPMFMGICAFVGAYLIKDNLHYLYIKTKEEKKENKQVEVVKTEPEE